ncbi:unknown [Ambystoma tigrinum stebbensi virus]|uniref:Uncharacterized protein n=2 Tax=Ranavirus ambystoma1 TaxID=265294 RepID=A0A0U2QF93_9VIRU|nr:hypothetical protein ATVp36 [Ambystoma tigrinum virus]AAP33213.1 unknown [Ambystoma tigrinum stebbensi virus]ALN36836.1 hypothetical protein 37R [Ambystoma tigrinum virus]ALN36937.1 hypothetical protein 36R [Ambystoma tigrinum virus]ALN37255.1 hypothetical protein 50R [Ambystoma tigrinum virus]ALN37635.1 hypothetical protein 38R [Ambystoma tigrinum virus]
MLSERDAFPVTSQTKKHASYHGFNHSNVFRLRALLVRGSYRRLLQGPRQTF